MCSVIHIISRQDMWSVHMKFVKMLEAVPAPGHIHLYWLGQAGFLIKNSIGKVILIDAYLSDYVEKTDKIDKLCSKRGAALYKFNSKIYRKDPKFKL